MKMKLNVRDKNKKILLTILFLFFLFVLTDTTTASFDISPLELTITMTDDFLNGNTSKQIIVTNYDKNESVNISWYLSDPEPISSMRANKTTVSDLSWIDLEPKWQIIPPNSNAIFYIHLKIPEIFENLNKNWESWITFKSQTTALFIFEHALRLYIDTPVDTSKIENTNQSDELINNILIIGAVAFLTIIFVILLMKFFIIKK